MVNHYPARGLSWYPGMSSLSSFLRRLSVTPLRVLLPLAMAACVSISVFAISEISSAKLKTSSTEVRQARELLSLLLSYRAELVDAETGVRGYLLTQKEDYLAPAKQAVARLPET